MSLWNMGTRANVSYSSPDTGKQWSQPTIDQMTGFRAKNVEYKSCNFTVSLLSSVNAVNR